MAGRLSAEFMQNSTSPDCLLDLLKAVAKAKPVSVRLTAKVGAKGWKVTTAA